MNKKSKKLYLFGLLLLLSAVVVALGIKYFPFTKVVKMPAGSEQEFVNPEKVNTFSPNTLNYDFEVAPGKEMPGGFYKGIAHSGQYSVKAFGQNSFSVAVERTAGEVGVENLKAVAISAWIYVFPTKKEVKGSLVFTASNEVGVNVTWQGIGIVEPEVPRGKWFKISKYFDLTAVQFKPGYKIQVYFWNNSSTDILVDDYFIAFGGPVDRRGDSARVDMTKPAGYIPKFNYPPFPVSLLEKEPFDNKINPADIDQDDIIIAGNFFNTGSDGLVVAGKSGKPVAYAFCSSNSTFRKISLSNPTVFSAIGPVKKMLKGKFLSTASDQLVVFGEKGWMIGEFTIPADVCSGTEALQTPLRALFTSNTPVKSACAGDFNGDHRSELLVVSENGTWKVMSFASTGNSSFPWKVIAQDNAVGVNEWNEDTHEAGLSAGRFLPGMANDIVLTVTRSKTDGKYAYSLRKLNLSQNTWDPCFSEKQHYQGKIIGVDTLKPADLFLFASRDRGKIAIFRYNRDWRYDMKEIRFNDTTFNILAGIDFHGYEQDRNPKYYESLKLIPGCFLDPQQTSFLTIGHVSKTRHYQAKLPDFVHLYSLPANK